MVDVNEMLSSQMHKVDYPVLLANLRWAAEENRKVEAVKTIRAMIRNDLNTKAHGADADPSLQLCMDIWRAFADNMPTAKQTEELIAVKKAILADVEMSNADYDAVEKLTSAERAAYDAGYNACAEEDRLTFESKPQENSEEGHEYLLIVARDGDTYVSPFNNYAAAIYAAEEKIANHLHSQVTVARTLACSVTKRELVRF